MPHYLKQAHGISPAGHTDEDGINIGEHFMFSYIVEDFTD
jgi:hypothetical protein